VPGAEFCSLGPDEDPLACQAESLAGWFITQADITTGKVRSVRAVQTGGYIKDAMAMSCPKRID
jgi:hypothetical protein